MKKAILGIAIAGAFLIGVLSANPVVYGAGQGDNLIVEALNQITSAMQGIEPTVTVDQPITINAPQGEQGPQGETGPQGPAGPQGESADFNSYWLNDSVPRGEERLDVLCNVGDKIIAGSVEIQNNAIINTNRPIFDQGANSDQEGWRGRIAGISSAGGLKVWAHCLMPLSMTVGGLAIQPDTVAILLAYGIMNSYWMLPTAIGIGVGVYLVKRKF